MKVARAVKTLRTSRILALSGGFEKSGNPALSGGNRAPIGQESGSIREIGETASILPVCRGIAGGL